MNGNIILRLAFRYFGGKGTANAVPVLSRISMVAIAVGSAAMIILFSVFNGFESLVKENYKAFYPDLRISTVKGKFFTLNDSQFNAISTVPGVTHVSRVIEDNVLASVGNLGERGNANENQLVVMLKGIDREYFKVNDIHQYLLNGVDSVSQGEPNTAIAGEHIIKVLGIDFNNIFSAIQLYYLNPNVTNPDANPESAFQSLRVHPSGAFSVLEEFDGKYILSSLSSAQKLFNAEGRYSSIEISAQPAAIETIKKKITEMIGKDFKVESRYEQNKTMYLVMDTEKWAVYFILLLVLLIASFNMVGALSMLVLEKRKDLAILRAMGLPNFSMSLVIMAEGILWALAGGTSGLLLGTAVCLLQQYFGIIKIAGSFLVDAYPVKMQTGDLFLVFGTIFFVGVLASIYPSVKSAQAADPTLKAT